MVHITSGDGNRIWHMAVPGPNFTAHLVLKAGTSSQYTIRPSHRESGEAKAIKNHKELSDNGQSSTIM